MGKIRALNLKCETVGVMVQQVMEKCPNAKSGIVMIFDDQGGLHTMMHCNAQEMALASVRLAKLANEP